MVAGGCEKMISDKKKVRISYFIFCCLMLVLLASYRDFPVYGKLDFLLLDNKPWWPEWKPMIESSMARGNKQPILSDPVTSTIMRGVFSQNTHYSRINLKNKSLLINWMDHINEPPLKPLSIGALALILDQEGEERRTLLRLFQEYNGKMIELRGGVLGYSPEQRFRCIINLHGFQPTWVPVETRHWSTRKADTKWFYRYPKTHIVDMKEVLKENPPRNCEVFY